MRVDGDWEGWLDFFSTASRPHGPAEAPFVPLIGFFGTETSFVETSLRSTLIAPNAMLVLGPGSQEGAFFARRLEVRAGTTVRFLP